MSVLSVVFVITQCGGEKMPRDLSMNMSCISRFAGTDFAISSIQLSSSTILRIMD